METGTNKLRSFFCGEFGGNILLYLLFKIAFEFIA